MMDICEGKERAVRSDGLRDCSAEEVTTFWLSNMDEIYMIRIM